MENSLLDCSGTAFAIQTLDAFRNRLLAHSHTEQVTEVYKYFIIIFIITIIIAYHFVKYIQNCNLHPAVKVKSTFNTCHPEVFNTYINIQ